MPKRRFIIIHRIPSPYRLHLFNCLHRALAEKAWELEVHFMDVCRGDRAHWNTDLDVAFKHRFWKNYKLPGPKGHFNPGLLNYIRKAPPEIVMLGGVWNTVTSMVGIGLLRPPKVIGWYEANDLIPGRMGRCAAFFKRYLLKRLDWHAVPGQRALDFLDHLFGAKSRELKISLLPNLVDEQRFSSERLGADARKSVRTRFDLPKDKTIIFTPARLIPKKGLVGFLRALARCKRDDMHYFILGDGPLQEEILGVIDELQLKDQVTLRSFIEYAQMPEIYGCVDIFCLPSVGDPNPLSVVEAMHSGLPVLLSDKLGNFPEAMEEGKNGFAFDPDSEDSIVAALNKMLALGEVELKSTGEAAHRLAEERWGSVAAVERFLEPILDE